MSDAVGELYDRIVALEKQVREMDRRVVLAPLHAGKAKLLTIVSGEIDATRPHVQLLAETGTTDNLDTINGGQDGKFVILSTGDPAHNITVRDMAVAGGNIDLHGASYLLNNANASLFLYYVEESDAWHLAGIPRLEELRNMDIEGAVEDDLLYKKADGEWGAVAPGGLVTTPGPHASTHQDGGDDEVATLTPAPFAIPKADASGTLNDWVTVSGVGSGIAYRYSTTTTDSDPGSGYLRFNHATFVSITQIYIDDENADAVDIQAWLATLDDSTNGVRGSLRIVKTSDDTVFRDFQITGTSVEATGYWKLVVTPIVSNGALANDDDVSVMFARAGDVGATGATGATGDTGATGATGARGGFGGNSMPYIFDDSTTDSDPGSGNLRFNGVSAGSTTVIFIDDNNAIAADIQPWISSMGDSTNPIKGHLRIFKESDSSVYGIWEITAVTEATGYWKITVTIVENAGSFVDADPIVVTFSRAGDAGADSAGMDYIFSTTTTDADPGTGRLRFNNATFASITQIYIDDASRLGVDMQAMIATFDDSLSSVRGILGMTNRLAQGQFAFFEITGASTEATGYWKLAVTPLVTSGIFADSTQITVSFTRTGDPTDIAATIDAATEQTVMENDNKIPLTDTGVLKWISWTNLLGSLVATFLTFTNKIAIAATATTGAALRVVRDLASGSTDSPVVDIVQDNAGDDQAALRVQQDGTGKIASLFDGASEVLGVNDGGGNTMGTGTVLDTTAMQLSSSAFTNAFFTRVAAATASRAEIIQVWKVSDSDDFIYFGNTVTNNSRFAAGIGYRNISSTAESFNLFWEGLAARDSGSEPAFIMNAFARDNAQNFAALATRPVFAIRNLSTTLMLVLANGDIGIGPTSPTGRLYVDQDSTTAAKPVLVLDQADVDQDMIEFVTTIGTGNAIEAVGAKVLTTTHFIKVTLPGGLTRYIPCGTIA